MTKPCFAKGRTGEALTYIATEESTSPLQVRLRDSHAMVYDSQRSYFGVTVRGSSKCRRKLARQLQRWLSNLQKEVVVHG